MFSALSPKKPAVEIRPVPAAPAPVPTPSASAIELTDVPVTGENEGVMEGDKLGSCVAGYSATEHLRQGARPHVRV